MKTTVSLFLALALPALAQFTTASLGGIISDSTGAPVPEAKVTARNVQTGFVQTATSNSTGTYQLSLLPVGSYRLSVEKQGFSTYAQDGLTLAGVYCEPPLWDAW